MDNLPNPNPKTDGMLPFMLNRLKLAQPKIEEAGHKIGFFGFTRAIKHSQLLNGHNGVFNYHDDDARQSWKLL